MDDKNYWTKYYEENSAPKEPSSFAEFINDCLEENKTFIELGCGNGRDSIYFSKKNINIIAVDQVESEVKFLNEHFRKENLKFIADDFTNLNLDKTFDYIYSRFTFHSINEKKEDNTIDWISKHLNAGGLFFLEARSIKDPMFKQGEQLSDSENYTTHYRRYMDLEKIIKKLENKNLRVIYQKESDGLSVYKDDNPVVIRLIVKNSYTI